MSLDSPGETQVSSTKGKSSSHKIIDLAAKTVDTAISQAFMGGIPSVAVGISESFGH